MLTAIRRFFDQHIGPTHGDTQVRDEHRLQVATAALLTEVMRMDDTIMDEERATTMRIMGEKFGLSAVEADALLKLAEEEARQSTDYHQFTSLINRSFSAQQKEKIVEYLWQVAYADGELDRYERHLVGKIADLLYVPHSAQIIARNRARAAGHGH